MGLFDKIKDKARDKFFVKNEEYENETENGYAGYAEENTTNNDPYDDELTPPPYDGYSYSPTGGLDSSEYNNYSSGSTSYKAPEFKFSKSSSTTSNSAPASEFKFSGDKKTANIYSMSGARTFNKFKLNYITLKDIYGAKDVALLMKEKDTIIVVDFSELDGEQKLRATDFIDGAKLITKAIFGRVNDNIVIYAPENVELQGDFPSQVDFDSIL